MKIIDSKILYIIPKLALLGLVSGPAAGQVPVGTPLDRPIDRTLDRALERRLPRVDREVEEEVERRREEAERLADELPIDETANETLQTAEELAESGVTLAGNAVAAAGNTAQGAAAAVGRVFETDVDPFGNTIEKNVLVLLVDETDLATAKASGLSVVSERPLSGLGLTLLTLRYANSYGLAEKALELRRALPDAVVDYNHLYQDSGSKKDTQNYRDRQAAEFKKDTHNYDQAKQDTHDYQTATARQVKKDTQNNSQDNQTAPAHHSALRIGLIDSAVEADHPVLAGRNIERRDFVMHDAPRPTGHGTAVASLLADAAGDDVEILAASVFFQKPKHAPGASTESLVAALDWLAQSGVTAINMSLAGPDNDLLERTLNVMAEQGGPTVVAAVGNNGPSGAPMYPGAYPTVIGVTAVDREEKIFHYANRGEHVDFAALGVNVKVANTGGGWRIESGTSMASPRVAAFVAALASAEPLAGDALVERMKGEVKDLGQAGFDPVFGHGLLAALPTILSAADAARVRTTPED